MKPLFNEIHQQAQSMYTDHPVYFPVSHSLIGVNSSQCSDVGKIPLTKNIENKNKSKAHKWKNKVVRKYTIQRSQHICYLKIYSY